MHKCYHNNFLPHAFCDGVFNMGTLSKQFSEKAIVQRNRLSLLSYGKIFIPNHYFLKRFYKPFLIKDLSSFFISVLKLYSL